MDMFKKIIKILLLLCSVEGMAQEAESRWPVVSLLPWQMAGVDPHTSALAEDAFSGALKALEEAAIAGPQSFSGWLQATTLPYTLNQDKLARRITVGAATLPAVKPIALQPVACFVGDRLLLALESVEAHTHLIVTGVNRSLSRKDLAAALQTDTAAPMLASLMKEIWRETAQKINERGEPVAGGTKLSFSLLRETTGERQGSSLCLNMLLAHRLLNDHRVTSSFGYHELTFMRLVLKEPLLIAKHNRKVLVDWDFAGQKNLPLTLKQTIRFSESVFGKAILPGLRAEARLLPNGSMTVEPANELLATLARESKSLAASDKPQIAKVDRAWVYLDRGRAWGLQMDDRLVYRSGDKVIKGHIVSFFGPEEKVISPRGYPVQEGAIMFIRKGQNDTAVGQEFGFDEREFPTPWPPTGGK